MAPQRDDRGREHDHASREHRPFRYQERQMTPAAIAKKLAEME